MPLPGPLTHFSVTGDDRQPAIVSGIAAGLIGDRSVRRQGESRMVLWGHPKSIHDCDRLALDPEAGQIERDSQKGARSAEEEIPSG